MLAEVCVPRGLSNSLTNLQGSRGPLGPPGSAGKRGLVVSLTLQTAGGFVDFCKIMFPDSRLQVYMQYKPRTT